MIDAGIVLKEQVKLSRMEIIDEDYNVLPEFEELVSYANVQHLEEQLTFNFIFRSTTPVITTVTKEATP